VPAVVSSGRDLTLQRRDAGPRADGTTEQVVYRTLEMMRIMLEMMPVEPVRHRRLAMCWSGFYQ
jgi:hypothetical protein